MRMLMLMVMVGSMIRALPDLADHLSNLSEESVGVIRLTPADAEDTPQACTYDLLEKAAGFSRRSSEKLWELLQVEHPDLTVRVSTHKFKRCRVPTPVIDAE